MATVLQVIPALNAGGAERTTIEMAEALSANGWRALVVSEGGELEGALAAAGGVLVPMPVRSKNPAVLWANSRRIRRLIDEEGVDIVHARSRAPAWSALWAARAAGAPFITTYHGAYSGRSKLKRWYNGVMARGDVVIANSSYMRDRIIERHDADPNRIRVIPRGVDLDKFDPDIVTPARIAAAREAFGVAPGDDRPIILLPARLTFWKGHEVALRALAELDVDAHLVFAGDGDGGDAILEIAAELGLGPRVLFPGYVADMPAAYAAADLALAPSTLPEAFGRTAAEAQAMGVPVIAAAHGGALEVVADGVTGWLVPPGDADKLSAAIGRALALSPEQKAAMGAAGRTRIASLYTARALQDATMRVYQEVLGLR